ncbi:hypothetical protein FSP39_011622 [Pinctada imbricata]|uniref:Uncharacterized protein n=1 Tax=Pinctada imbricata TaxID=66713 RepID=A0AA88YNS6_PINIB|nr:hypothetical protein FSP39_011622 [Pinctada imbricata]
MFSILLIAPRSPDEKPFYFGSSDLFCTTTGVDISIPGLRRKRSAPARDVMELVHSWIYYDGLYFEFGVDPEYGFKMPFSSSSKVAMFTGLPYLGYKCPWRREPFPAGYSSLPVGCLQRCASRYEVFLGRYSTLFNNCHHFSNLISDILCSNQCPSWCDM